MKKILIIIAAICIGLGNVAMAQSSQLSEKEIKEIKKDAAKSAKNRVKELKKQKWEYNGTSDLETKIERYIIQTDDQIGTGSESIVELNNVADLSVGEKVARIKAGQEYAAELRTMVAGTIDTHTSVKGEYTSDIYLDNWSAKVAQEIKSSIHKSFVLYKKDKKTGKYNIRVYFVVDNNSRKKALEDLADEIKGDAELSAAIRRAATENNPLPEDDK